MPAVCDVTIVIPQRNEGALTLACVRSLQRWTGEPPAIVVVDDGSTDESAQLIRDAHLPDLRVLEQPGRGVTAAWNTGVRATSTAYIVLLNNDVLASGPFLEGLLRPLRENRALMTGVTWRVEPCCPRRILQRLPDRQLLGGWCFACAKELWTRLGEFDESLRLYFSDTDFQCRAAELDGHECAPLWVVPSLPLKHLGHRTTRHDPQRAAQWHADRETFVWKWTENCAARK